MARQKRMARLTKYWSKMDLNGSHAISIVVGLRRFEVNSLIYLVVKN